MSRCAALVHLLTLYLQDTLAVGLNLALVLVAVAALTRLLVSISKIHQAAVLNPPSHSNKYMDSYSSGSYSRCSHSRDYHHRRSPPPAPQLASSHLPTLSRDESELEELTSELVNRLAVSNIYSTRSSYRPSSHALASSRRSRSRSRTPQPSRRWY
ncbi:hypothetical protein EDD15DRAFT_1017174 [Pisolithus albus]|nr:hypothetical protein EDD15DRAFT_1017174 [Pisolithus albus]